MRRQSVVLIVSGVALLAAAAASLFWWHVQRPRAPPADIVEIYGQPEFARIDIAVKNPARSVDLSVHAVAPISKISIARHSGSSAQGSKPAQRPQWRVYLLALEECLAWRGLSPTMTGRLPSPSGCCGSSIASPR